jgi:hypothetical protein
MTTETETVTTPIEDDAAAAPQPITREDMERARLRILKRVVAAMQFDSLEGPDADVAVAHHEGWRLGVYLTHRLLTGDPPPEDLRAALAAQSDDLVLAEIAALEGKPLPTPAIAALLEGLRRSEASS